MYPNVFKYSKSVVKMRIKMCSSDTICCSVPWHTGRRDIYEGWLVYDTTENISLKRKKGRADGNVVIADSTESWRVDNLRWSFTGGCQHDSIQCSHCSQHYNPNAAIDKKLSPRRAFYFFSVDTHYVTTPLNMFRVAQQRPSWCQSSEIGDEKWTRMNMFSLFKTSHRIQLFIISMPKCVLQLFSLLANQ